MDRECERRGGEFRPGPSLRRKIRTLFFFFFFKRDGKRDAAHFYSWTEIADTRGGNECTTILFFSRVERFRFNFFFPPLEMNVNFNRSWVVINSIIFIVFVKLVFSYVMIKIIIISWILNETMIGALMMNFKRRGLYFKKG